MYFRTPAEGMSNPVLGWIGIMWLNIYSQNTELGFVYTSDLKSLERYKSDFKATWDTAEKVFWIKFALKKRRRRRKKNTFIWSLSSKRCDVEELRTRPEARCGKHGARKQRADLQVHRRRFRVRHSSGKLNSMTLNSTTQEESWIRREKKHSKNWL